MTYGKEFNTVENKLFIGGIIFAMLLLFVALSQPVWNSKKLIQQKTDDCKAVHGVLIIDHGTFGDTYSCQPRFDRGIKE